MLPFTDTSGKPRIRNDVPLPSPDWFWVTDWTVEHRGDVDADGWQYANDVFAKDWAAQPSTFAFVRRRRWVRICKRKIVIPPSPLSGASLGLGCAPLGARVGEGTKGKACRRSAHTCGGRTFHDTGVVHSTPVAQRARRAVSRARNACCRA